MWQRRSGLPRAPRLACELRGRRQWQPVRGGLIATLAGLLERNIGITTKPELLFLTGETIFQPPELAARRLKKEEEAPIVGQLYRLWPMLSASYR